MNKRSLIKTAIIFFGFLLVVQLYITVFHERFLLSLDSANEYDNFTVINQFKQKCLHKQELMKKQVEDRCSKTQVSYYTHSNS